MSFAEVAVDAPFGYGRTLSYSIPPSMELEPGQLVWVPLGPRPVQGIVFHLADQPQVEATRPVIAPVEPSPILSEVGLELARWISTYYMSSLFEAASLMLPPGFETQVRAYLQRATGRGEAYAGLSPKATAALDRLPDHGEVAESALRRAMDRDGERELRSLLNRGLVERRWEMPQPRLSHRYECYIQTAKPPVGNGDPLSDIKSGKQKDLYFALLGSKDHLLRSYANKDYGAPAVDGLLKRGLVALQWVRVAREPELQVEAESVDGFNITLTREQRRALGAITASMEGRPGEGGPGGSFLLHGVTGSGKTEVYLSALERCLALGKTGIFLVPEISLTPQTVHRLSARFPGRVAVLHSRLSVGELFDQWWKVRHGEYDVVVGPRSALFAPLGDLGLIVMDEEHEWTYKQQDTAPRYHTRNVALKLSSLTGAAVVMGSATPDVETYYRAKRGIHTLMELPTRVATSPAGGTTSASLAHVEVCDMRRELREGNRSIFSRKLAEDLQRCVDKGEQAVLFINRRGSSTVVQCRDCGHSLLCRRCSVTLTSHAADQKLLCHQCNARTSYPKACPQCRSPRIRYLGLGTQRVMDELKKQFPTITALRWDSDTAGVSRGHESIMARFQRGEAQVLVGTQMVAKGLHVPNVSLVGVMLADIGLNLPDFRAGERAFQLLCQVAGRAGRGIASGRVIIQTYNPTHYAVSAAAAQDYAALYSREIEYRRSYSNPPFSRLIHMVYQHTNAAAAQTEAERMGRVLRRDAYSAGLGDFDVVGPAPAFPERVRGRYRWHIVLRGRDIRTFLESVTLPQGWTLDVDPVTVM